MSIDRLFTHICFFFDNAIALYASQNIDSKDLVTWERTGHLLDRKMILIKPKLNMHKNKGP